MPTSPYPCYGVSPRLYLPMLAAGVVGWWLSALLYSYAPAQDLMVFHTAGRLAVAGDFATLNDADRFTELLARTHSLWLRGPIVDHPWVYPPLMLLIAEAIATMPFEMAYVVTLGGSLLLLLICLWMCWPCRSGRPLAIALLLFSPATGCCLAAGQLSFLVASIMLLGLWLLPGKEFPAGLVLSLLILKPQFALLVPVALIAGRHFRALLGFVAGAGLLVSASAVVFGIGAWLHWLTLMSGYDPAFSAWESVGRRGGQSVDAYALSLGASKHAANMVQLAATVVAAGFVGWFFARVQGGRLRMIVFPAASMLGAPHASGYDAVLLTLSLALVLTTTAERRMTLPQLALAVLVWLSSLLTPPFLIAAMHIPFLTIMSSSGPFLIVAFVAVVCMHERGLSPIRRQLRTGCG